MHLQRLHADIISISYFSPLTLSALPGLGRAAVFFQGLGMSRGKAWPLGEVKPSCLFGILKGGAVVAEPSAMLDVKTMI